MIKTGLFTSESRLQDLSFPEMWLAQPFSSAFFQTYSHHKVAYQTLLLDN